MIDSRRPILLFADFFMQINLQINSVITITVITNSRLKRTKFVEFFGPKWLVYYIKLHSYYEQLNIDSPLKLAMTEFDCTYVNWQKSSKMTFFGQKQTLYLRIQDLRSKMTDCIYQK
jgi:hypothetical protein